MAAEITKTFSMKKTRLGTILIPILCILFVGCTQNPVDTSSTLPTTDREFLKLLGYELSGMIEQEEYYLLVPDIVISKEELANLRNTPKTRMQRGYDLLTEEYQTIYYNDAGIGDYRTLLTQAVAEWNKISDSNIKFVSDNTASLTVNFHGDMAEETFAPVSIENPSHSGQYSKNIVLNYAKVMPLLSDPARGKYFMMHILGHIAGFGHAVADPFAMPDGKFIAGTTIYDPASIMRSEDDILYNREEWTGFSSWDIKAIQFVYPFKEKPTISLHCTPAGTGPNASTLALGTTYVFTAKYEYSKRPHPKYQITISKTDGGNTAQDYEYEDSGNGIFSVRFLQAGTYKVSVVVTNVPQDNNTIERTYTVPDITPTYDLKCTPAGTGSDNSYLTLGTKYYFTAEYIHPFFPAPNFDFTISGTKGGAADIQLETLGNGKISVTFYNAGKYRIKVNVTNIGSPAEFENTYILADAVSPACGIDCFPSWTSGTQPDKKTLSLGKKYFFKPYCYIPNTKLQCELIDIEGETPEFTEGRDFEIHDDTPIQDLAQGYFHATFHTKGQYRIRIEATNGIEFEEIFYAL